MFIKKYLWISLLPFYVHASPIVGKWEINMVKTKQSISALSISKNAQELLILLANNGFKSIECFPDKRCVFAVHDRNTCLGSYHWAEENKHYTLTAYDEPTCKNTVSKKETKQITIDGNQLSIEQNGSSEDFPFIYQKSINTAHKKQNQSTQNAASTTLSSIELHL